MTTLQSLIRRVESPAAPIDDPAMSPAPAQHRVPFSISGASSLQARMARDCGLCPMSWREIPPGPFVEVTCVHAVPAGRFWVAGVRTDTDAKTDDRPYWSPQAAAAAAVALAAEILGTTSEKQR